MIQPPLHRDLQPVAGARNHSLAGLGAIALLATNACGTQTEPTEPTVTVEPLFKEAFRGTNGRSCATCHVPEDNFTLTPEHVARLLETNPNDPLFAAIDADDPVAETLTFEHLEKGLVRVWLPLPDNMDVIDDAGNVTTPPDRKIFVWRGVPSIADSALTAPYQLDGRVETLEEQAQGALTGHSGGGKANKTELERIAEFERSVFSSDRAREVADELASGVDFGEVSDVEALMELSPAEERGREVYEKVCASCHGGANKATIADRAVHDLAFPALKPDGNVLFEVPATDPPTPVLATQPDNEFINIGSAMENFLVQLGATEHESFTKDVSFPAYRFRFYKDGSRTEVIADLPPALPPGDPFSSAVDPDGNPITGPNFFPQFFTTDPGRALITGSPYDFEAFDIPTLRGIAGTAPYWHNNISETLEDVVELYSDHLLAKFPSLTLPGEKEPDSDGDIGPPEALTKQQKSDLVAFLKRL
ncbi:c-type cytochrome [Nannocystis sp. SCPEA4]|uniref:c-type cytochrome n=1 Tax=Nannocystis sp. SCPEA4 TaxID=2996787 RepID=UPI00226D83E7|nr:c-type cytochrome [Nannocystis sp. SCPEA4]MCY1058091.1 c-type cytochrome [Nannocystis sp. SCPEA4]